jgi:hypothetical protein
MVVCPRLAADPRDALRSGRAIPDDRHDRRLSGFTAGCSEMSKKPGRPGMGLPCLSARHLEPQPSEGRSTCARRVAS